MAERIPSPGVAEVSLNFTQDGQKVQNVYHVKALDGVWDIPELQELALLFRDWWSGFIKSMTPGNVTLRSIIVQDLTGGGGAIEYTTGLPLAGTLNATPLPNNVTVAVKWVTGLMGRSFRGRTYHIGLGTNAVTGNVVNTAALDQFKAAYETLRTNVAGNFVIEAALCVLSERANNAPRAQGVATIITGCTIDAVIDSQRRRLPQRGQ